MKKPDGTYEIKGLPALLGVVVFPWAVGVFVILKATFSALF